MNTSAATEINLDYRPSTYFWPHGLEKHLLARIKGAARKAALKALIDAGQIDEYGGDTLTGDTKRTSEQPLILGELHRFFMAAWPFTGVLEMNFENDVAGMLGFCSGHSAFYGQFDALRRQCVTSQYASPEEEL